MTILYFKLYAAELGLKSAVKRVFVYGWVRGESTKSVGRNWAAGEQISHF